MPDIDPQGVFDLIQDLFQIVFGSPIPNSLLKIIGTLFLLLLAIYIIWFILRGINQVWYEVKKLLSPIFYSEVDKVRAQNRKVFAKFISKHADKQNEREDWRDLYFQELEAEVEIEGKTNSFSLIPPFLRKANNSLNLRKVKKLSKALKKSQERLILLEGVPGAGKSVSLRHVAVEMAEQVSTSRNLKSVIPLYINLKGLIKHPNQSVDSQLIKDYILEQIAQANDSNIDAFMDREFDRGLIEGTWLFLLDGFDEIPEVLSSTDVNVVVKDYAAAISDFVHGMNECRCIVASRPYKGPSLLGWPKFRILPLSEKRIDRLVSKTTLSSNQRRQVIEGYSCSLR